jgi:hypothetical protein
MSIETEAQRDEMLQPLRRMFDYLDELRESGQTNMYGAGPYLVRKFGVSREESHKVLQLWMEMFGERHPQQG